jgi:hypothetical protein
VGVDLWPRRADQRKRECLSSVTVRPTLHIARFYALIPANLDQKHLFEIVLASGDVVRVPSSFDGVALARLLDVLARSRS